MAREASWKIKNPKIFTWIDRMGRITAGK